MLNIEEYNKLITSDKKFNKEQMAQVAEFESMIYYGKIYYDMIPEELKRIEKEYDYIMLYLSTLDNSNLSLNTRYALGRYNNLLDQIDKINQENELKNEQEYIMTRKLINKTERNKGFALASSLIIFVSILGIILSIGLLSLS